MVDKEGPKKPLKVAYYLRVSTEDQVDKYGLGMQKKALDGIIEAHKAYSDIEFAGERFIYKDEGISGTLPLEQRPEFARLQEDILNAPEGEKPFDLVAVYKIDRFARKLKILLNVLDFFRDHKIDFISVNESIDTSSPFGRAILGIVGALSELELETILMRTKEGKEEAIRKGVFMGKVPPYGYNKDSERHLIINEEEAEVIKKIYDLFLLERLPIQAIGTYLQENHIQSPGVSAITGKKRKGNIEKKSDLYFWTGVMIRKILSDEIYLGRLYYGKTQNKHFLPKEQWKLSNHSHQPIIDQTSFERVQALLKSRKGRSTTDRPDKHVYLLSGLLKCSCCYDPSRDKNMQTLHGESKEIGKGSKNYNFYYKCRRKTTAKTSIRCGSLPLPAKSIENYVVERIKELLSNPRIIYNYQLKLKSSKLELEKLSKEYRQALKLKNAIPEIKERLKEQHQNGIITMGELRNKIQEQEQRDKNLEDKLSILDAKMSVSSLGEGYVKVFEKFSSNYGEMLEKLLDTDSNRSEIHQLLSMVIDKIIVYSRPVDAKDVIAGKKAKDQQIPYKLDFVFRLPQEYLQMLKEGADKTCMNDYLRSEEGSGQNMVIGEGGGIRSPNYTT